MQGFFACSLEPGFQGMKESAKLCRLEDNQHEVTAAVTNQVILPATNKSQISASVLTFPLLLSASSKCTFWQSYNFISFGATIPQRELEK